MAPAGGTVVRCLYLTHPQVVIESAVPVPQWGLSPEGRARVEVFASRRVLPEPIRIIASTERKAIETAEVLAAAPGTSIESHAELGENDRSATGYMAPAQFERLVTAFFANPETSVSGWETAAAAQARIVAAVQRRIAEGPADPAVFVGHGGVGTLLKCALGGRKIARSEDQREMADPGGGNVFVFDAANWALLSDWQPMETFEPRA